MVTCTLNGKEYRIDFVTGRALREIEPAAKMYSRVVALSNAAVNGGDLSDADQLTVAEALDVMIHWFCLLFQNQFTPDELLDGYPADRLMHDIAFALMAVQTQTTSVLESFPTKAAEEETAPKQTGPVLISHS
ncbi:MAG: hypothetical protein IKH30_15255 [Clostridia bacterium]|nr:hypothetical protein [Clostridia bacterium]MBR4538115.1 hypothetical protein [Clostridia bacterium]